MGGYAGLLGDASVFSEVSLLGGRLVRHLAGLLSLVVLGGMVGVVGPVAAGEIIIPDSDGGWVLVDAGDGFSDIAEAGGHRANVETLAGRGILDGTECAPGRFCPKDPIERWVMAVWLVRAVDGASPAAVVSSRFVDVETGEWWLPYVERLADLGITRGCAVEPARFCPGDPVTRQEMASFLVRAFQLEREASNRFADVEAGNSHLADINGLATAGITAGCSTEPALYCPTVATTRAEMATFLARALGIATVTPPEETTQLVEDTTQSQLDGDFTFVATGRSHACGVRFDHSLVCWGENWAGQAEPPEGEFVSVALGWAHSCGIRVDQTISCWGGNWDGQAEPPDGEFASISAGENHMCALREDGGVVCWGRNDRGQINVPDAVFSAITAGESHTCGLRSTDHNLVCWGDNEYGQADPPQGDFASVSAGDRYSCGLKPDGVVTCWGANGVGQGDAPARRFTLVAAGWWHSCGIRTDQTVVCWGHDEYGRADPPEGKFASVTVSDGYSCGIGASGALTCWGQTIDDRSIPQDDKFTTISAGASHACGLHTDQTIRCWGRQWSDTNPPEETFTALAAGQSFSCGVRSDQTVSCWGANGAGQAEPPDGEFSTVTAGWAHTCGIRTDQTIVCWGNNDNGQADTPQGTFIAISAGVNHSCGVGADQTVVCWGSNYVGQTSAPRGGFVSVDAGDYHTCGIRSDQTIVCWGYNGDGQTNAPNGHFREVAAGTDHSCGLHTDESIICWGENSSGESDPPEGAFASVVTGAAYSCGLRTSLTLTCWGRTLVIPAPQEAQRLVPPNQPDPNVCRPQGTTAHTVGFPLYHNAAPAVGTIKVAVLFVDFPDASATHTTQQEAQLGLPNAKKYLETVSYRKLNPQFVPLHRWLRAENNYAHYLEESVVGLSSLGGRVNAEAARLADPEFDFTDFDAVMVVMPSSYFGGGIGGQKVTTDEGSIWNTTLVNSFPEDEPGDPQQWGSTGAHELVHNLGLADLYPYDGNRHKSPYRPAGVWVETEFGLMGLNAFFHASEDDPRLAYRVLFPSGQRQTGYTQRLEPLEMLAWSRWQLGWLEPDQIHCVTQLETETTITISPVALPGNEGAMIAIPVSETELIVIESRRKLGYDAGQEYQWPDGAKTIFPSLVDEGILVYTVNASLETGQLPIKVAGDPGNGHLESNPILTEGQSITIWGYTITVHTSTYYTDTITITKTGPQ